MIKVVLAEVIPHQSPKDLVAQRLEELQQLVETYGGLTVMKVIQQKSRPDYQYYIWSGKLEEIKQDMIAIWADILIIGNVLKPRQIYQINEFLRKDKMQARDRVDLILKIFEQHAQSMEARLQVELAAIKHMGPRIFGMGMELSRQWWWSKLARWVGETNTEIMKRHLSKKLKQLEKELKQYEQVRSVNRDARKQQGLMTIWLVWYTNAGKSSLMKRLTGKDVLIEDKLFATLGTNVGQLYIPSMTGKGKTILINDTIGFMRDLPPSLISAFRSTLEDSITADHLLHVIDATDPLMEDKIQVVETILYEIWATQPLTLVFNKIDLLPPIALELLQTSYGDRAFYISSVSGVWVDSLIEMLDGA
jgi:GTP-binding protein HflX